VCRRDSEIRGTRERSGVDVVAAGPRRVIQRGEETGAAKGADEQSHDRERDEIPAPDGPADANGGGHRVSPSLLVPGPLPVDRGNRRGRALHDVRP